VYTSYVYLLDGDKIRPSDDKFEEVARIFVKENKPPSENSYLHLNCKLYINTMEETNYSASYVEDLQ
jgi:hypothetical protein